MLWSPSRRPVLQRLPLHSRRRRRAAATGDGLGLGQTVVLATATALGSLSIDLYLPAFPELSAELNASEAAVQLTLTACVLGIALGQLVAGPLSDAVGRRRPIAVGLGAWSLASFACALAPTIGSFTLLRFVQGLAGSAGIVVARAVVRDRASGAKLVVAFARLMLVVGLVPILAPTVGGLLLEHMSWRGLFVVLGAIGAVFTVVVLVGLEESLPPRRRTAAGLRAAASGYGVLIRDKHFLSAAFVVSLTFSALFIYVSSASFVLRQVFSLSPGQFGLLFGVNSCGLVLGNQVSGALARRRPPESLLPWSIGLAAASAVTLLVLGSGGWFGLYGVAAPLCVMVFAVGASMPVASSRAMGSHPERAGAAAALLGVFQFAVGGSLAPVVGALGATSVLPLGLLLSGCLLASLTLYLLTRSLPPAAAANGEPAAAADREGSPALAGA